jgi:hypothetical protein
MLKLLIRKIYRVLGIRKIRQFILRYRLWLNRFKPKIKNIFSCVPGIIKSGNTSYELTPRSKAHLACALSVATGETVDVINSYLMEIENDQLLQEFLLDRIKETNNWYVTEYFGNKIRLRERIAVYALVRTLKPKKVVETGVEYGVTSCVVSSALMKNSAEGSPGTYTGIDIQRDLAIFFKPPYSPYGEIIINSSDQELESMNGPIDLYINDSSHDSEYSETEYNFVVPKLSEKAIMLSWSSPNSLMKVSNELSRNFLYFHSEPDNILMPHGRIGISFNK